MVGFLTEYRGHNMLLPFFHRARKQGPGGRPNVLSVMELSSAGVVGRVAQEHETKRSKDLEKLAKTRKAATKAVAKATVLLEPGAAVQAEEVAKRQTRVDRASRALKEETGDLESLGKSWSGAFGDLSTELVLLGDLMNWAETMELQLRSVKAELEHSKGCLAEWQKLNDEDGR